MSQSEHPHDPFGGRPAAEPAPGSSPMPPPSAAGPQPQGGQQPFAGQQQYANQQQHAGQQQHVGQQPYGGAQQPGADGPHPSSAPLPPGFKGLYEGPLSGQGVSASDSRMWAMFAQLSAVIGYVVGAGFLGWLGPLIIFLMYKDRDRYVRYNAAESLNAAIATVIAEIALLIVISILAVVTFGIGSLLYPLVWVPAVLHVIFAIIGAVKANQGVWWNYPLNIRLVK